MTPSTSSPIDAAAVNWRAFNRSYYGGGHEEYVRLAKKCSDYFMGYQWDPKLKKKLEDSGKPALTLNEVLQVINAIYGQYSQTRADISFKARGNGATTETAAALTRLVDGILDMNKYRYIEATVVDDGWIEDRGYIDVRMDYTKNVLGEISLSALDPRSVILDPDAKEYDPKTWNDVIIDRWLTYDDIESHYGKKVREKVEVGVSTDTYGHRSVRYETFGRDPGPAQDPNESGRYALVRVIDRQYRKMALVNEFVDLASGDTRLVPDHWEPDRVAAMAERYGLQTRKRMQRRVRWTVSADHTILHDDWSLYDNFTPIPYFPIFRRGNPSGLVRHLLDPQEQLNKIESQILHVINTTANSGWQVEENSLANMDEDDLETRGGETGLVIVRKKGKPPAEKILPNQVPSGLENYANKARAYIKDIPGASALLGDSPGPEVSGVALSKKEARALSGLLKAFDNLEQTRRLLAEQILYLVQKFYTEPRVYRIANWRDPEGEDEDVAINQVTEAGEIINNLGLGKYDIVVGTSPVRDTFEEIQFAESIQLRDAGIQIPDHHVILNSHIHGKHKIAEEVKQMQGLGEPSEMQQAAQELELRTAAAELATLEAKAGKLQADAQLATAKAQTAVAGEQRQLMEMVETLQLEAQRIQNDMAKARANLNSKTELANIHTQTKKSTVRYQQLMKSMDKEQDRDANAQRDERRSLSSAQR